MSGRELVVVAVFVVLAVAAAFALGWWAGRHRADDELEAAERELAKARRAHSVFHPGTGRHALPATGKLEMLPGLEPLAMSHEAWQGGHGAGGDPRIAFSSVLGHETSALLPAPVAEEEPWTVTGEIARYKEEMDRYMAGLLAGTDAALRQAAQ